MTTSTSTLPYTLPAAATKKRWQLSNITTFEMVLLSQLFVIIPHIPNLPNWLWIYALVVIAIQLPPLVRWLPKAIYRPRNFRLIQYVGFFGGLVGLYLTYRTALGLDVGIAFLLLCAISKLLELYTRRDAYVVLTLSLFVLAGLFLIDQDLSTTLIVGLGSMAILFAMIGMNDDGTGRFRSLGLLVGQAIPLTIVLFLFFPRLPPLWSIQLSGKQATTGMSDSMSPGDFAKLSQSTELAFRVEFDGAIPSRQSLYWRGLVFSDFNGITWRPASQPPELWYGKDPMPTWLSQTLQQTDPKKGRNYKVILERTGQAWLFGLDYPMLNQRGVALSSDFTLRNWEAINQQFTYQVHQLTDVAIDATLPDSERRSNLALPSTGNEQSRAFAKKLFEQSGRDPMAYSRAIQAWINQQPFRYTLSPPALQNNRIDEFLFGTRAGFCEHYSSSYTFLMRAAGVPARVVVGYQGGEKGRDGKSWEVRQMDAHAWSEIWVAGQGWVRVDPTAFVSPDRVERGMDNLTQTAGATMFGDGIVGQISYQQFQMLQQARRLFDQASYYWQRDVVGYDQDTQKNSLLQWFNIKSVYQQVMVMFSGLVVILATLALWLWWRRRKIWDKSDLVMVELSKRLGKMDSQLARQDSEGVIGWLQRIAPRFNDPKIAHELQTLYRQTRYAQHTDSHQLERNNALLKSTAKRLQLVIIKK